MIYKEKSQGPEALRPWFIIPAKEDEKTLPDLCFMFESELHEAMENLKIKIGQKDYNVELEIANLLFDTKLIRYLTGLHGAFCTMCDASEKDGCDTDCIEQGTNCLHFCQLFVYIYDLNFVSFFATGFVINRSQEQLNELYEKLPHDEKGKIKIKKKEPYSRRTGLTQKGYFEKLDVTQVSVIFSTATYPNCNLLLVMHLQIFISEFSRTSCLDMQS